MLKIIIQGSSHARTEYLQGGAEASLPRHRSDQASPLPYRGPCAPPHLHALPLRLAHPRWLWGQPAPTHRTQSEPHPRRVPGRISGALASLADSEGAVPSQDAPRTLGTSGAQARLPGICWIILSFFFFFLVPLVQWLEDPLSFGSFKLSLFKDTKETRPLWGWQPKE